MSQITLANTLSRTAKACPHLQWIPVVLPVLSFLNPTIRRSAHAAKDVIDLAAGPCGAGQRGYFIMSNKAESSKASQDEEMQAKLWNRSVEWAGITQQSTSLPL
jgi:hypothetical protein